ncbi:uncharacterized protein FIBRA_07690 [Fibroporia radiculosa]|uniref:THIF-type NAD/FAD binding fold domain-containing protein n=1 Tax=Fibroporia radiculosa TaxID=599839 RepID=J4H4R9_9APHY|nr:uncharacterized protein FIBRA_07690 [Fibroporia radiculosa]CCM05469.1 predicted protein [Fibroporia radiculosa]
MNLNPDVYSHRAQLVLAALTASAATVGIITAYQQRSKSQKRRALAEDIRRSLASAPSQDTLGNQDRVKPAGKIQPDDYIERDIALGTKFQSEDYEYDEELVREQLARNYAFFGEEGMEKVRKGSVVVVGCGGVGSWAAIMLVRSGISRIRLVDFDYVTLSSLNRHATAVLSDVGTPKVNCVARTLKQISRSTRVDARVDIWRKEQGGELLEGADWVIDAIDNITTKVDLLKYCHDHNIKVFSSMGAGAKCDPTRIQISDISYTIYDPLARSVRRRLRLQGVTSGIPVVYSTEVPGDVKLLPLPEEEFHKGDVKELGVFDDFRVRILPVLGPLPSIFGLHIATYILCELAGKPIMNPLPIKGRKKFNERLYRDLLHREEKFTGQIVNKLPIDEDDVGLLFDDIHRGRSVIPPHPVPSRPSLVRWDPAQPLTLENCVAMEHGEAERHVAQCYSGVQRPEDMWGTEAAEVVKRRVEEIKKVEEWVMSPGSSSSRSLRSERGRTPKSSGKSVSFSPHSQCAVSPSTTDENATSSPEFTLLGLPRIRFPGSAKTAAFHATSISSRSPFAMLSCAPEVPSTPARFDTGRVAHEPPYNRNNLNHLPTNDVTKRGQSESDLLRCGHHENPPRQSPYAAVYSPVDSSGVHGRRVLKKSRHVRPKSILVPKGKRRRKHLSVRFSQDVHYHIYGGDTAHAELLSSSSAVEKAERLPEPRHRQSPTKSSRTYSSSGDRVRSMAHSSSRREVRMKRDEMTEVEHGLSSLRIAEEMQQNCLKYIECTRKKASTPIQSRHHG